VTGNIKSNLRDHPGCPSGKQADVAGGKQTGKLMKAAAIRAAGRRTE
jgi:hypothetical protein